MSSKKIVIRKSPIVIAKNIIVLQFFSMLAFYLAAMLADYGELYKNLNLIGFIRFQLAEMAIMILWEITLVSMVFARWSREIFKINGDTISHKWGLISKKEIIFQIKHPITVQHQRGLLHRLIDYGTLIIYESGGSAIMLDSIPNPEQYIPLFVGSPQQDDEPQHQHDIRLQDLLLKGEHEKLEYKSSLRWDSHGEKINKNLEKATMKTVAAFLNSGGGHLVIGVDDAGKITGIHNDYETLGKKNADGFENHFSNLFNTMLGAEFRQFVHLKFHTADSHDVCLVSVAPSTRPAYLKADDEENFYIRTGNATTAMRASEIAPYVSSWWKE